MGYCYFPTLQNWFRPLRGGSLYLGKECTIDELRGCGTTYLSMPCLQDPRPYNVVTMIIVVIPKCVSPLAEDEPCTLPSSSSNCYFDLYQLVVHETNIIIILWCKKFVSLKFCNCFMYV